MMFSFTILCLFLSVLHAIASPLMKRTVYSPPITYPTATSVWKVGDKETITWDTSKIPSDLTTLTGKVVLGYETDASENLQLDKPLAQEFMLTDGNVTITVPNVVSRKNYIVVLFGDSGNASPQFQIVGATNSLAASSSATSLSSTLITEPIPITGTTVTGGVSATGSVTLNPSGTVVGTSDSSSSTSVTTTVVPSETVTVPSTTSTSAGATVTEPTSTSSGTATASETSQAPNAAWRLNLSKASCLGMASFVLLLNL